MCGAASRQVSTEEYTRTLEVMNQTKERIERTTDNLKERQHIGERTSRITNREYNRELGRLGLLRALVRDCLVDVSFVPLVGATWSGRTIPSGSTSGLAGVALASTSLGARWFRGRHGANVRKKTHVFIRRDARSRW